MPVTKQLANWERSEMNTGIGEAIRRTVPAWRREHFNRLAFPAVCFLPWTTAITSRAEEGIDQLYSAIRADDLQALRGLLDKDVSPDPPTTARSPRRCMLRRLVRSML